MIRAIAIDDEPPALKVIEGFCAMTDLVLLEKTFTKPTEALKYLRKFPADLIFLDIKMPSMNGMELHRQLLQSIMVIFTTAHSDYAVEGFNVRALDYLLKPFTKDRFMQAVTKANEYHSLLLQKEDSSSQYLFIRADYSLIKIAISDILYIEGLDDYLKIHLPLRKPVVARMTMKAMLEKLPPKEFVRVHRSYIIPLSKIDSIRNKIILLSGMEIPIGTSFEENFQKFYRH